MKIFNKIKTLELLGGEDPILKINGQYEIYDDGVVYDNLTYNNIPQWVFELRDCLCGHFKGVVK